jgi:hypothetical protein
MPLLVHIASESDAAAIARGGIKPLRDRPGIYAMPVMPNFVASHQWLRELKRRGDRTMSGVCFRIPDGETVLLGHYSQTPVEVAAAQAAGAILNADNPLGMQIVVPRKILPKEIVRVRRLPQTLGWHYYPKAHGVRPCGCPACIGRGDIKSRKLRAAFERSL